METEHDGGSIDITGLDRAAVLHALYHGTRALGLGRLHDSPSFSIEDAREEIELRGADRQGRIRFDYVCGRPIKIWFEGERLTGARLYDRDAGYGAAKRAIDALRKHP